MKKLLAALLSTLPSIAFGQGAVLQTGPITQFDAVRWNSDKHIEDAGGLTGKNGHGLNPFSIQDNLGIGLQLNTALTSGTYHALGIGHNAAGEAIFNVDGTEYPFIGSGSGNVTGPNTSAVNHRSCFNNGGGTLLLDCTTNGRTILSSTSLGVRGTFGGYPQDWDTYTNNAVVGTNTAVIGHEWDLNNPGGGAVTNTLHVAGVFEAKFNGAMTFVNGLSEDTNPLFSVGYAQAAQGGTVGGAFASGRVWGAASQGWLDTGATGYVSVIGHECNSILDGTANQRYCYWAVDYDSSRRGNNEDAAYALGAFGVNAGWAVAFGLSTAGGANPIVSTGTILKNISGGPNIDAAYGIDLRGFTFSAYAFASGASTFTVDQAGDVAAANLTLSTGFMNGTAGLSIQTAGTLALTIDTSQYLILKGASSVVANGVVATVLGSVGPVGSHTTVQEWIAIKNSAGVIRFLPAF